MRWYFQLLLLLFLSSWCWQYQLLLPVFIGPARESTAPAAAAAVISAVDKNSTRVRSSACLHRVILFLLLFLFWSLVPDLYIVCVIRKFQWICHANQMIDCQAVNYIPLQLHANGMWWCECKHIARARGHHVKHIDIMHTTHLIGNRGYDKLFREKNAAQLHKRWFVFWFCWFQWRKKEDTKSRNVYTPRINP